MGHQVLAMEYYSATDQRPLEKCLSDVASCDLYIGIFAWRYGYIPPHGNPEARSITELEFRKAKSSSIPCLLFLLDEAAEWIASDIETGEGSRRLKAFKEELRTDFLVSTFHSPDDLATHVSVAVAQWAEDQKERISVPPKERRYRDLLLTNLEFYLNSLSSHARHTLPVELMVEECPELVRSPGQYDIRRVWENGALGIIERFDRLGGGGALLLVSEAGSGKTASLIKLARHLLERARSGSEDRLPILLNLASWPVNKLPFRAWLIEQLSSEFDLPREYGQAWCEKFTLLLDGLDALLESGGVSAIQSLNEFRQQHPLNTIVVACRKGVYSANQEKLTFHAAIQLRPLNDDEIGRVIASEPGEPGMLGTALANNAGLRELAKSPLWLWLMSEIYRSPGSEAAGAAQLGGDARRSLCGRYVALKLDDLPNAQKHSLEKTRKWLAWLARNMGGDDRPFFFQTIQPTLLSTRFGKCLYTFCFCALLGCLFAVLSPVSREGWLIMGAAIGVFLSWRDIQPLEHLHWRQIWLDLQRRWKPAGDFLRLAAELVKRSRYAKISWKEILAAIKPPLQALLGGALVIALVSFAIMAWQNFKEDGLLLGLAIAFKNALLVFLAVSIVMPPLLVLGFVLGVPMFLLTTGMMMAAFVAPFWLVGKLSGPIDPANAMSGRESTRRQVVNILVCTLLGASSSVACVAIVFGVVKLLNAVTNHKAANPSSTLMDDYLRLAYVGAVFGLAAGLAPIIRYVVLRLILWMRGDIPFFYGRFLKYAVERALLKREGRGVIFIHEYLQAYFASLPPR
jgi:eukaryotic-like serine/threonine-protein kinase